jgi:hypothetical protein
LSSLEFEAVVVFEAPEPYPPPLDDAAELDDADVEPVDDVDELPLLPQAARPSAAAARSAVILIMASG